MKIALAALVTLTLALTITTGCDAGGPDEGFTIEVNAPSSGKADQSNDNACHYKCTNNCPKDAYCLMYCVMEEYGNCGDNGRQCNFTMLCAPGYTFDDNSCGCRKANKKDGGCTVDGQWHPEGSSFAAADGCNTCWCGADGMVACTKIACYDTTSTCGDDPTRSYVSDDPATCQVIKYTCESGSGFSDDCGCGCYL